MGKSRLANKAFGTALFIALTAVSLYCIYLGCDFIKSVIINVNRSGFGFYDRFPSVLWGGVLEHIIGTILIILLSVKQFIHVFGETKKSSTIPVAGTLAVLALMTASEILSYASFVALLGRGYSILNHLQSYLCVSGVIRAAIFVFFVFYLIVSVVKSRNANEI